MKMDPFTQEEIIEATELFFDSFDIVHHRMPTGCGIEDTLKVVDYVIKTATKLRSAKEKSERDARLGFIKECTSNPETQVSSD
tara:strand:+ start:295 stop:543 length:249 start_codon:yes stop_codon:yes gene_type:complete